MMQKKRNAVNASFPIPTRVLSMNLPLRQRNAFNASRAALDPMLHSMGTLHSRDGPMLAKLTQKLEQERSGAVWRNALVP